MKRKERKIKKGRARILAVVFAMALAAVMVFGACAPEPDVIPPAEPSAPPPVIEPEPEPEPPSPPTYPLTGLEAPDENAPHIRTLSVKIENTPEAKPQLGITRADVVYETVTEGGITRFNCMFQSDIPDEVGPVRSARDSDMSIVPEYNALFFFSGTNSLVWARMGTTSINEMNHSSAPKLYHRVNFRAAPHDLFLNLGDEVFEVAKEMGYEPGNPYPNSLMFGEQDLSGLGDADDAVSIFVPYSGGIFDVTWEYDSVSGTYLRYIQGKPQVDMSEGSPQITAENVVLLYVPYRAAPDVPGKGQTWNIEFTGSGQAVVFRDGKRFDCLWTTDGTHPPQFIDASGNFVNLKPGKTWFQVPPNPEKMVVTTGHEAADAAAAAAAESAANADANDYQAADAADTD